MDTGFTGDYETARMVYAASKDEYYGNTGYSMDHERLPGRDVRLLLVTEYGTPGQAYREHLEAKTKLTEVAASFHGTDTEKAEQIFGVRRMHLRLVEYYKQVMEGGVRHGAGNPAD